MYGKISIILMTTACFLLVKFWFSSKMFGKHWKAAIQPKEKAMPALANIGALIVALITACSMAKIIDYTQANTLIDGIKVGSLIWVGCVATTQFIPVLWENRPISIYIMHASVMLVRFVLMGAVFAFWR